MELKYTNLNGEISLASRFNYIYDFFLIVKIEFRNESYKLFFQNDAMIPTKQKFPYLSHY